MDGGVTSNIIYGGAMRKDQTVQARWNAAHPSGPKLLVRYWVILNNKVMSDPKVIQPTWPAILGRSVELAIRSSTVTSLRHLFTIGELVTCGGQADCEVRYVAIPASWQAPKEGVFVKETMVDLSNVGMKMGADPKTWQTLLLAARTAARSARLSIQPSPAHHGAHPPIPPPCRVFMSMTSFDSAVSMPCPHCMTFASLLPTRPCPHAAASLPSHENTRPTARGADGRAVSALAGSTPASGRRCHSRPLNVPAIPLPVAAHELADGGNKKAAGPSPEATRPAAHEPATPYLANAACFGLPPDWR